MSTQTIPISSPQVNSNIGRARRAAYKHGMKMLKRKDGTYRLTRLIPPKYTTAIVLEGLSPESILDLCFWLDRIVARPFSTKEERLLAETMTDMAFGQLDGAR